MDAKSVLRVDPGMATFIRAEERRVPKEEPCDILLVRKGEAVGGIGIDAPTVLRHIVKNVDLTKIGINSEYVEDLAKAIAEFV